MKIIEKFGQKNMALEGTENYPIRRKLSDIQFITWHWNGNPGAKATGTMNYFENEALGNVNSTFLIETDGTIYQFLPLEQVPYTNGNKESNIHSVTIEFMHKDSTGELTADAIWAGMELSSYLMNILPLHDKIQLQRHYDVTGKVCPLWYSPAIRSGMTEKEKNDEIYTKNSRWNEVKRQVKALYEKRYITTIKTTTTSSTTAKADDQKAPDYYWYRVVVSSHKTKSEAQKVVDTLKNKGTSSFIVYQKTTVK